MGHKKRLDLFARYGDYEIYDDGRVYSNISGKFLKPSISHGYKDVTMSINHKPDRQKVHRLVAINFIDNPDNLPMVNHKNGIKADCRVENLEWCTAKYNNEHARRTGLNNVSKSNSDRWKDPEFRERTRKHMSDAIRSSGASVGERNPRFRYRVYYGDTIVTRKELAKFLDMSQSYIDAAIRKAADGKKVKIFKKFGITVHKVK